MADDNKNGSLPSFGLTPTIDDLYNSNKTIGRIQTKQCCRREPPPASAPPQARHEMRAWDGVEHGSAVDEYLKSTRNGLDEVRGDAFHYQLSFSVQDAAISEGIGAVLGRLLQLGGRLFGALRRSVKPRSPSPEPAPKPASPGNGTYVEKPRPRYLPRSRPASEEIKDLSKFEGKTKSEIEAELREQGYTEVQSRDGTGSVWTKEGSDGNTAAVRLDRGHDVPEDYAGAKPHAHKEIVSSEKVTNGNYKKASGFFNDTGGSTKFTDFDVNHIPIRWE